MGRCLLRQYALRRPSWRLQALGTSQQCQSVSRAARIGTQSRQASSNLPALYVPALPPVVSHSRCCSTSSSSSPPLAETEQVLGGVPFSQLRTHFIASAVPMIGFGVMDNSVMLHAGNTIDLTLGVTFGLSTLASAACGQACSDVAGVLFGGFVENLAKKLGLPEPDFTDEEQNLPIVKRVGVAGGVIGIFTGCCMGLLNLFIIDTNVARQMKLSAKGKDGGGEFSIDVSNEEGEGFTQITIEGPEDIDGVIASVTTAMAVYGCTISELNGRRGELQHEGTNWKHRGPISFKFRVQQDGEPVDDERLEDLGAAIFAATKDPSNIHSLAKTNESLRMQRDSLTTEIEDYERILDAHLVAVSRRTEFTVPPS
mmetsp:Transcript_31518/g.57932  ORF Transcript_31518/g.57932 Transcript_31518/m.57932 type:complete len:370 (+) Transcript_31518:33-1142(+)